MSEQVRIKYSTNNHFHESKLSCWIKLKNYEKKTFQSGISRLHKQIKRTIREAGYENCFVDFNHRNTPAEQLYFEFNVMCKEKIELDDDILDKMMGVEWIEIVKNDKKRR